MIAKLVEITARRIDKDCEDDTFQFLLRVEEDNIELQAMGETVLSANDLLVFALDDLKNAAQYLISEYQPNQQIESAKLFIEQLTAILIEVSKLDTDFPLGCGDEAFSKAHQNIGKQLLAARIEALIQALNLQ